MSATTGHFPRQPGELVLEHRTPDMTYRLATIAVRDESGEGGKLHGR